MMRSQDELRLLGFAGIYKESFRAIFGRKKIFTIITFALILPICIVAIAHTKISELFFGKIFKNQDLGAYDYYDNDGNEELTVTFAKYGWISLWVSKVVYFVLYFVLSLLPTSVIATAMFGIYTDRPNVNATFTDAITTAAKSFKKLGVTFLWSFGVYSIFNLVFLGMLIMWRKFIWSNYSVEGIIVIVIIAVLYFGILPYLLMIWQLANVVSVLEDVYGRDALRKGWSLMSGKKGAYISSYVLLFVFLFGVHLVFRFFVGTGEIFQSGGRFMLGFAFVLVLMVLELLRLVTATVVYFVCKSYHHENVDGSMQTHNLEFYGRSKDVHHEQLNV